MPTEYSSQHRIGDDVTFRPRNYPPEMPSLNGRVVVIRITEQKMSYDVLSLPYGKVFKRVECANVLSAPVANSEAQVPAPNEQAMQWARERFRNVRGELISMDLYQAWSAGYAAALPNQQ